METNAFSSDGKSRKQLKDIYMQSKYTHVYTLKTYWTETIP